MQLERPVVGGQRMTLAPLDPLAASYSRSPPLSGRLDALAVDHRGRRTRPTTNPFAVEHDQVVIDPPQVASSRNRANQICRGPGRGLLRQRTFHGRFKNDP